MKSMFILLIILMSYHYTNANTALFSESGQYVYSIMASVSTGSIMPNDLSSSYSLKGVLSIQKSLTAPTLVVKLSSLQHAIYNEKNKKSPMYNFENLNNNSEILTKPFVVNLRSEGTVDKINFTSDDILWSMNIKRAIAVSLQMQNSGRSLPGAFVLSEPCLHGDCIVEYSSSDGITIRKSNTIPTLLSTTTHDLWMSVMPNVCARNAKNPLIGISNKLYEIDDKGLSKLLSEGNIEVHYHNHIFQSLTNLKLARLHIANEPLIFNDTFPVQTTVAFQPPQRNEPTGGRAPLDDAEQLLLLWQVLGKIADGLEQLDLTDALLQDKLPLRLQEIISTLSYETLKKAHNELELGTSYKWETMKNIFLQVLPQVKSKAAILLIRDMVVNQKIVDEITILQLLRRMPFNAGDLSQDLLVEMEAFLKLGQVHSADVRHAAILSFSTLVYKTFIAGACTPDVFEDYVQVFFSRFTESPEYQDRLVWLSGLSNLQLQRVTSYLAPVIQGTLGHSPNERFLAVWATMALASLYPIEVHNTYWPILHNPAEPLEMRIAAITMLMLAEPTTHRLLSLHWYISSQKNRHISNFFYSTIKSLEKTTFDCYNNLSKSVSYLSKIVKPPQDREKYWATGNYLFDLADESRDIGFMFQILSIANPSTDLPNILYFTTITQNGGLNVQDYSIYLKLQGVISNFFDKLDRFKNGISIEYIGEILKHLKVQPQPIQPVHVELLLKYQGKVIYTLHLNQTNVDKLTEIEIMKKINAILTAESHINQQILLYPTMVKSILPSEIGTPIITDTVLSSLTSIRGNLTFSPKDDQFNTRKNDIHFRTSTLALLSLSTYNPIQNIYHMADVAQVSDTYLPANFTITWSWINKILRTTWFNPKSGQSPGFVAYSGSKISTMPQNKMTLLEECYNCSQGMINTAKQSVNISQDGIKVQCYGSPTAAELFWKLVASHSSNANVLPTAKPLLLLLHSFVLGTLPPKGPCELVISTSKYHNIPKRSDTEIELFFNSEDSDKIKIEITTETRSDDNANELLSFFNLTKSIEWSENEIKIDAIVMQKDHINGGEWKTCFNAQELFENDVDAKMKSIIFNIMMGSHYYPEKCPSNGTSFSLSVKPNLNAESKKTFELQLQIENLPSGMTSVFSEYNNALDSIEKSPSFVEYDLAKFFTNRLSKSHSVLNATLTPSEDYFILKLQSNDMSTQGIWKTNLFSWMAKDQMKNLKEIGLIKECYIKPESILDAQGNEVKLQSSTNCELLAFGECTNTSRFAILKLPSPNGLAIRIYIGGNHAEIRPLSSGLNITVNENEIKWPSSYQIPEHNHFYDLKITGTDERLKIKSKRIPLKLIYEKKEAKIIMATTLLQQSCGACLQTHTLHTKC